MDSANKPGPGRVFNEFAFFLFDLMACIGVRVEPVSVRCIRSGKIISISYLLRSFIRPGSPGRLDFGDENGVLQMSSNKVHSFSKMLLRNQRNRHFIKSKHIARIRIEL